MNEHTAQPPTTTLADLEQQSAAKAAARFLAEQNPMAGLLYREDWSGLRVCIYCRISRDPKNTKAGVKRQRTYCEALVNQRGGTVVEVHIDNDISASRYTTKKRPGFDAMIEGAEAGRFDVILCTEVERLYRRRREFAWVADFATQHAGKLTIVTLGGDVDLSTPDGRFKASIQAEMAIMESEKIARRKRMANHERAEAGLSNPSIKRSFGWERDGMTQRPMEAKLVEGAYQDTLAGVSSKAIAKRWAAAGVETTTGGKWSGTHVRKILLNPRNVGDLTYQGKVHKRDCWDGIVDRPTWEAVKTLLEGRPAPYRATAARGTPFAGLLHCGRCGGGQVLHRSSLQGVKCWRCPQCSLTVTARPVEEGMWKAAVDLADTAEFRSRVQETHDDEGAIAEWNRCEDELRRNDELKADGRISEERWVSQAALLEARRDKAKEQIMVGRSTEPVAVWLQSHTLREDRATVPDHVQRNLLHLVYTAAVVNPATVRGPKFDPNRLVPAWTDAAAEAALAAE